jgi:hypothetical protein
VFSIAAAVMLCTVAIARESPPPRRLRDPRAARDLVALMRAGERGSWLVRFDFSRTLANGRELRQPMSEARDPGLHVLISGSAMTVERGSSSYDCNLVGSQSSCTESTTGSVLPASEVLRVAVAAGAYDVSRSPAVSIAGERAECFRVVGVSGQLPDLGTETDMCLSSDGIPLSQRVVRTTGDVDERVASSVDRHATTRAIEALEQSFAANGAVGLP